MGLKLKELQKVVNNVVKKEKNVESLREELKRVLGPTILTTRGLVRMAESANEYLDVLEATGRTHNQIRPSLLVKFADSESSEVRKLVVRLLPENFLKHFMKDENSAVRTAVAKRLPYDLVVEMTRKFPSDDSLKTIQKLKKLTEAGIPDPDIEETEFDMYGEKSMGDLFGGYVEEDHSDVWYDSLAHKIVNTYGRNVEEQWEEATVHQFVNGMKSMGVDIDRQKLLDAVYDLLERRADAVLEESSLRALASRLRMEDTTYMPIISEVVDSTKQLMTSRYTTSEYIKKFEEVFSVNFTTSLSPAYNSLREGSEKVTYPISAKLPGSTLRNVDERAIDNYVNSWNTRESIRGNTIYKLQWSPDPEDISMVNFHLELK